MAKAAQTLIPGTTADVPESVQDAADKYLKQKLINQKSREQMNGALESLIHEMREADVTEMLIDDGDKRLILDSKDCIKIQARKKDEKED